MTQAHSLGHAVHSFEVWLKELEEKPAIHSADESWAVMRAVLQTLRDRLPVNEAVHFSAQLPLIARGVFFEGWKPGQEPHKYDQQQFYEHVREKLDGVCAQVAPEQLIRHVFEIINHYMDPGQVNHVKDILPGDLASLWPEQEVF